MFQPEDSVLIGVSGGPDSVALLHILVMLASTFSLKLGVAHLNHGIRGKDSDLDAEFVSSLAKDLDLPFHTEKTNIRTYQHTKKLSLEEAARHVRYNFFTRTAEKNGFNKIALGHHRDDNAELVLMYIFRGSGLLGISGIPPVRAAKSEKTKAKKIKAKKIKIVRPLMGLKRSQIIDFLTENGLEYVSDASNKDERYIRNRIRHRLIPTLKRSYNPRIIETLNRLSSIIRCEDEWVETIIQPMFEQSVIAEKSDTVTFSVSKLNGVHIAAKRRIIRKAILRIKGNLRRITFSHIDSVICLMENGPAYGSLDFPDQIRIARSGDLLSLSKETNALRSRTWKLKNAQTLSFEYNMVKPKPLFIKEVGMYLKFTETGRDTLPDFGPTDHRVAFFDRDSLKFPLFIRNVRPGDRFTPLGMSGTQKVKKYFINNKVDRTERAKCPVLLSRDKIIWVVGHRIDASRRILPSTRNVLKVELFLA